ncbi:MAG: dihydropteroate synthase [candidate division KSB1 bacterium]|nr:dihydropteroate synthase [candidate division KSB1 bacterium]MDZ7333846.1 dihydropteroate synthase [candidate division KSB1 bacterium]MDZ7356089.1 dihydropteroate synthase [candidate division KSB1 bacterium]MDZ7400606.1 dihydropteroate synthase [candidate division KSB1 bacterium]
MGFSLKLAQMELARHYKLSVGAKTLDLSARTHIMGILNVTPDSFSDGGEYFEPDRAIARGMELARQGADIIDVGAESTRPGAEPISAEEEIARLLPVIRGLANLVDVPISVDTYKAPVAEAALHAGANMINDISGLRFDPDMKFVVARFQVPVVLMHIKGQPKNMQQDPHYDDVIGEICDYLAESIEMALAAGIPRDRIIIDPGIGFGKRLMDNYEIIRRLKEFSRLECPILVGPSRKSFIGKVLNLPPDQRLEGTIAAVVVAIQNGAHIIRVHDVLPMVRACQIADRLVGKIAV